MRRTSISRAGALALLTTMGVLAPSPTVAQPRLTAAGTAAGGSAIWSYLPEAGGVTTPMQGWLPEVINGGNGFSGAAGTYFGKAPGAEDLTGFEVYWASASLGGPNALPVLKARANSGSQYGAPPDHEYASDVHCCFYYNPVALADAVQWYQFTGTQRTTFTLAFAVDAIIQGTLDPLTGEDFGYNGSVGATMAIFDGRTFDDPDLASELPFGYQIDRAHVELTRTNDQIELFGEGMLTFELDPGQSFFLVSSLVATIRPTPGWVTADASNTMTFAFTQGPADLLVPQLRPDATNVVPEPSTWLLMMLGLTAILVVSMRRRVRNG